MRGLLVKDLRLLLGQKKFLVLVLFMTVVLNFNGSITFVVYYLTFVCSFFVISSIAYDENDNGYPNLFCLPIDRSIYVREKYVFEILLNMVSWLAGLAICFIIQTVRHSLDPLRENIMILLLILPAILIFDSVVLPLQFKFCSEKGRIVLLCCFIIVFFMGYTLNQALDLGDRMNLLIQYHPDLLCLALAAAAVLTTVVSYAASVAVMKRKEF